MPPVDWSRPPPVPEQAWTAEPQRPARSRRGRIRALTVALASAAAVGTGALVVDLAATHATTPTAGSSTGAGTSSTGTSSTGTSSSVQAPGSASGSSAVHASSGGS